jgi:hypothetical protein
MDYDLEINYHPVKANVVVGALSRRSHVNMLATRELLQKFCKEFEKFNLGWVSSTKVITMEVDSSLEQDIRKGQLEDAMIQEIKEQIKEEKASGFSVDEKGTLWYKRCLCVPEVKEIRELILREAHDSAYSIHPGSTKMYHDLQSRYWWYGMKRAIAEYVALCDNCQRVKAERQQPTGLLQPLKIPQWKWEEIVWILLLDYLQRNLIMILFGLSLINFQRLLTLYRSRLCTREQSLRNCILLELCVYTECPRR